MTPLSHQHKPIQVLAEAIRCNRSALDASDTGVGKTYQALFAIKAAGRKVAVVCPKSVKPAWVAACEQVGVPWVFIENIEALKAGQEYLRGDGKKWWWAFGAERPTVVFDEVHRFSGYDSENGVILATCPPPVLMLSATAASDPSKMRGIGHQLRLCKWDEAFYWCGRYGCKRCYFGGIEFKGTQEHLDRLHRQIFTTGLGVRVRISEIPDFPQNTIETIAVPVEDQKAVNAAYEAELKALESQAPNAAVEILRARQIAEHQKLEATCDLISDLLQSGNSVAVFVNFTDSRETICHKFSDSVAIYGDQGEDERAFAVMRFQNDDTHLIVCQIQAGGVGLSLHDLHGNRPRVSITFPGWSAIELKQALGRIHRAGAKSPALQKLVFAAGTVEERIREKVNRKLKNIETLNDGDLTMKPRKTKEPSDTDKQETSKATGTGPGGTETGAQVLASGANVPGPDGGKAADAGSPGDQRPAEQRQDHSVRQHADISPSKLKNLELSPLWRPDKNQEVHFKTERGTRCHEALETGDDSKLHDDQEREWVRKCQNWLDGYSDWEAHREIRLEVDSEIYGFADVIFKKSNFAILVDFKFSESLQEDAETNPAAQAYVLGIFNKWPEVDVVDVCYLYPIRDEISQATYFRGDHYARIRLRIETIKARVREATTCTPYPETCTYCGNKARCAVLHKMALPVATRYAEKHEMQIPAEYDPSLITDPKMMGKALSVAGVMDEWVRSVKFHAVKLRQESGLEIPGFDLRSRTGKKHIVSPTKAYEIAATHGVTKDEFLAACEVSVKQLADCAGDKAPRGGKKKAAQQLEDELRDAGVLEIAPDTYYLQRSKG